MNSTPSHLSCLTYRFPGMFLQFPVQDLAVNTRLKDKLVYSEIFILQVCHDYNSQFPDKKLIRGKRLCHDR